MSHEKLVKLRGFLKARTADRHDVLDGLGAPASFADREIYARFLSRQYAARAGIERWTAGHAAPGDGPPPVAHLIAADLAALGSAPPSEAPDFTLPAGADQLGLAWVIAGSHLGNRAMLARLRREAPDAPATFLADETMRAFWTGLRPRLEREVPESMAQGAVLAAEAVFDHFLAVFGVDAAARIAA